MQLQDAVGNPDASFFHASKQSRSFRISRASLFAQSQFGSDRDQCEGGSLVGELFWVRISFFGVEGSFGTVGPGLMCCWEEGGTFCMYFSLFDAGYFHVRGLVC